jgi:nucleotide-binding universal stress UspA family protein
MPVYRRVLVPTDGSPLSAAAFPHVRAFVAATNADIVLLRVVPTPAQRSTVATLAALHLVGTQVAATLAADADRELVSAAQHVQALRDIFESEGMRCTAPRVAQGLPGPMIVRTAEHLGCDVIIMSTHGRSGLRRLLLGSVAEYVARHLRDSALLLCPPS